MEAKFPHLALSQDAQFHLAGQSLDPEESITGDDTIVPTMRGRWMATVSFALQGEAAGMQWQAFLAQMQGRIGTTLVPARSRYRPKNRDGRPLSSVKVAGLASGQTFEHFGFAASDVPRIRLASAAALRATEIDLTLHDSTGLRPGQFFSLPQGLHRVQHHWQPGGGHRVMIEPPLRAAAPAGTALEIADPVCRMRMVTETEGLFDQCLDVLPTVRVQFREAL